MLIKALCDYYDVLAQKGAVLPEGYSSNAISYLIALTPDGKIADIIDYQITEEVPQKNGKFKSVKHPVNELFPKRESKSGINSEYIEHRAEYIFGLALASKEDVKNGYKATFKTNNKKYDSFKDRNSYFVDGIDTPLVNAFRNYLNSWNPEDEINNPVLKNIEKDLSKNFAFCLDGHPEIILNRQPEIKARWEELNTHNEVSDFSQCAITGEDKSIARLHDKIKGVRGGQASGTALVCFNNDSEESYGQTQSYNSNISEEAMLKYTQALNFLLANDNHRTVMDDVTVIHWAANGEEELDDIFSALALSDNIEAEETDKFLKSLFSGIKDGVLTSDVDEALNKIDRNTYFYIAGIKPNASRLSLKFIYRQQFGDIVKNILQHHADMKISADAKAVPLWRIKKELISPNSKSETLNPAVMAKLFDSVVYGYRYPVSVFDALVRRVRIDRDDEKKDFYHMNTARMGMLKAYINREARFNNKQEVIKMALDLENNSPSYLCGRLFAILEEIQRRSASGKLNRTIKDTYFSSASTRPAVVFPKLLSLSQHHMARLESNYYADRDITEILDMLGSCFPKILSLTEQGVFMLGYYQQKQYTLDKAKEYNKNKNN